MSATSLRCEWPTGEVACTEEVVAKIGLPSAGAIFVCRFHFDEWGAWGAKRREEERARDEAQVSGREPPSSRVLTEEELDRAIDEDDERLRKSGYLLPSEVAKAVPGPDGIFRLPEDLPS